MSEYRTEPSPLSEQLQAYDNQQDPRLAMEPIPYFLPSYTHLIVGSRGQGKTSNWLSLVDGPLRGKYQNIWLISQTARNDAESKKPLKELIEELDSEGKVYDDLTEDIAVEINNKIDGELEAWRSKPKKKRGQAPRSLIILDDCLSSLPRGRLNHPSLKWVVNGRHKRITCIIIAQKMTAIPTVFRANASVISLYPTTNKREYEALANDLNYDRDEFDRVYSFATNEPRSFLHINLMTNPITFFKRFDRIQK